MIEFTGTRLECFDKLKELGFTLERGADMYVITKDNGFQLPITYFAGLCEDEPALFVTDKSEAIKFNEISHAEFYIAEMNNYDLSVVMV